MDLSHIKCPRGVAFRIHKHVVSVQVVFTFNGRLCKETIRNLAIPENEFGKPYERFVKSLEKNIRDAQVFWHRIKHEILVGDFDYAYHFPNSRQLKKNGMLENRSGWAVSQYIDSYLQRAEKTVRPSTFKSYKRRLKNLVKPVFGEYAVVDLKAGHIRDWVHTLSLTTKRKTISNTLSPCKHALDDAVMDGVITVNPARQINLNKIISVESRQSEFEPDPFTEEEIWQLLDVMEGQIKNIFQFAFYSGLRTNELIGLKWSKVNWNRGEVLIDEAMVDGAMGPLKTSGKGVKSRAVLLHNHALDALLKQKQHTFLENDFVFHNPLHDTHWQDDAQLRRYGWVHAFKKAGIRYRNPYQTRHTFAHRHIRNNENLWWIADQLGHTGIEMLNRHYGGWLKLSADCYFPLEGYSETRKVQL